MRGALSELKAAPMVWSAVLLAMVVSQTVICSLIAIATIIDQDYQGPEQVLGSTYTCPALAFSVIITIAVLLWVMNSALNQRRHQLALMVLQGALPWQLLAWNLLIVMGLFILSIAATCLLLPVITPLIFAMVTNPLDLHLTYAGSHLFNSLGKGLAFSAAPIFISTLLTIRSLSKIRPMEALRQSQDPPKRIGVFRFLLGIVCLIGAGCMLLIPAFALATNPRASQMSSDAAPDRMTVFLAFAMGGMFLLIFSLAAFAPYLLPGFTAIWTRIVALPSRTWRLAGQQAVGSIQRQGAAIIPMTAGLSLLMTVSGGLSTMITTLLVAFPHTPGSVPATTDMFASLLALTGPPIIIAITGAIAGTLITSKGRGLDLALTYVSGAGIGQLRVLGALDGIITMITSTLFSLVITLLCTSSLTFMLSRFMGKAQMSVQWGAWIVVVLIASLLGAAATGIQALTTRFENSVSVISHAIGE